MKFDKPFVQIALPLALLVALALACGGGKPVAEKYRGNWQGTDGSTIYMTSDGQAGFKVGSKSVDGGGAVLDETAKTLTISLMGISNTWTIDKEPNDAGEMKLSGTVFRRK
jgi:formylmethanofuran dehydrogenase subunit C